MTPHSPASSLTSGRAANLPFQKQLPILPKVKPFPQNPQTSQTPRSSSNKTEGLCATLENGTLSTKLQATRTEDILVAVGNRLGEGQVSVGDAIPCACRPRVNRYGASCIGRCWGPHDEELIAQKKRDRLADIQCKDRAFLYIAVSNVEAFRRREGDQESGCRLSCYHGGE